jgi:hypothetical protein
MKEERRKKRRGPSTPSWGQQLFSELVALPLVGTRLESEYHHHQNSRELFPLALVSEAWTLLGIGPFNLDKSDPIII